MAPTSEPEVTTSGGAVLVDTTTADAQKTMKDSHSGKVLGDKFKTILQLLLLVNTLIENLKKPKDSCRGNTMPNASETRKAFDYLDAITNVMVRDDEVVAAVACGGPFPIPTKGIISVNSPCETPPDNNVQVRPQSKSYVP